MKIAYIEADASWRAGAENEISKRRAALDSLRLKLIFAIEGTLAA